MDMPFFDPNMAEVQRRLALDTEFGVLDLETQNRRLVNDFTLLMGTPEAPGRIRRQLEAQTRRTADSFADRGFHGQGSGVMRQGLGNLAEDQADSLGMLYNNYTRGREDIARQIAHLESRGAMSGAESVRGGAAGATGRVLDRLPF